MNWLSKLLDTASNYFAHRKGLLPLLGILFVIANFTLQVVLGFNFDNVLLHLGVIIAIIGFMLSWAL